jgi:hypothetical protein
MEFLKEEQHVNSKETFIRFMDALQQDWKRNHKLIRREYGADTRITGTPWRNCYLLDFLEGMEAWIAESKELPSDFPYKALARILAATTMYQGSEIKPKKQRTQRLNCWEVKECGREPGGRNAAELGICSASVWDKDGEINGGKHGGRVCWVLVGTLCGGKVQGTFASKVGSCLKCNFYQYVRQQEGRDFRYALPQQT